MFNHKEQQGFLTIAYNTNGIDYFELAYLQALSLKRVMPGCKTAVVIDKSVKNISDKVGQIFDYIIQGPESNWPMEVEPELFWLTPFKETIKLESDIIITRDINHWWYALRLRNLVLSYNCRNIEDKIVVDSEHRKFWLDNDLPNVYNGLMYFRYSQQATEFFLLARQLFQNYDFLKNHVLKNCREEKPSTDVIYSVAAKIFGIEKCTVPTLDFFNFVHMKSHIQNWPTQTNWNELVMSEIDSPYIRINNLNQYNPVHYHVKNWPTDTIINRYEYTSGTN